MRFSIIVPIYNVEDYIHQCIESVLKQNYKDYELILVDDGSPDNCPSICDDYAKKNSKIKVVHKQNGGLVTARKAGVEVAEGDYSIALDGDDWLHSDCLSKLSEVIDSYHPEVVRFGLIVAEGNGKCENKPIRYFRKGFYKRGDVEEEILPYLVYGFDGNRFPHSICGGCISTSLYREEQLSVEDRIKIGEDGATMRPIVFKASSVFIMDECLYYYRRNLSSMTKNRKPFSMDNFIWITEHYAKRMDLSKYDLQQQIYRSVIQNIFTASVTQFWQNSSYKVIRHKILSTLDKDIIKLSISKAKFKFSLTRFMMLYVMRHRLIPILWLYSKIKKF